MESSVHVQDRTDSVPESAAPVVSSVLASLQVGGPEVLLSDRHGHDGNGRTWRSGIYKHAIQGAVWLGATNLKGDGQADLINHGGSDKAVCVYSADHYPYWKARLGQTHTPADTSTETDIFETFGAFGENFSIRGLTEQTVCIGDVYRIGEAVIQVSQPRAPCWKLARKWGVKEMALYVQETGYTGWYFRVFQEGNVSAGQTLERIERPHPHWTVAAVNQLYYHDDQNWTQIAALIEDCTALTVGWRVAFARHLEDREA